MSQPGASNPNQVLVRTMAQANQARRAGRMDEAERLCRGLLAMQPNAVPALNFLSLLLSARGELDDAEAMIRRAIALSPREAALHNNLGNMLHKRKDIDGAAAAYRTAIARKHDYPEAHYNLGLMLRELGQTEESLKSQRAAVALKPDYADAIAQIGLLQSERREFDDAVATLDRAIAADPNHFAAHHYRGTTLISLRRHQEAIGSLRRAVELRPQSHEAHYALGNAYSYLNQEVAALEQYQRAIELNPEYLLAHYDFNSLAWTMGRQDLSLKSYIYARGRVGDTVDLLFAEGDMRLRLAQPNEAEVLLRKAQLSAPDRADIANALGRTLVYRKRFDESIPEFERAAALQPKNIVHRQEQAIALLHAGRAVEAIPIIEAAREIAPADQLSLGLATLAFRERFGPQYHALFDPARFVRVYDVPPPAGFDTATFNAELANELMALHTRKIAPFDQTLRGGTQTMGHLFARKSPRLVQFHEQLLEVIRDYIASLPDDAQHPFLSRKQDEFTIAGSWSCRLRSQGFHTNHVHPMGWISSAYYVALPDAVLHSGEDRQGWIKFGESNLNLGANDRPEHAEQPAVGRLVLFPSYFWHGTMPFVDSGTRLTIAFDVIPGRRTTADGDDYRNY